MRRTLVQTTPLGRGGRHRVLSRRRDVRRTPMSMLVLRILPLLAVVVASILLFVTQPVVAGKPPARRLDADPARLRAHVEKLAVDFVPRDLDHVENLDRAADYLFSGLRRHDANAEL